MNNMFAQQTADAIETLTARDDSLRKALTFLARRIKAIDGHIGIDSAQEAREGGKGMARSTSYMTRSMDNKPRLRHTGTNWVPSESMRAAGAEAARRSPTGKARWSIDSQTWEAA